MFVCTVNEAHSQQKQEFTNFYYRIHNDYGFTPDKEYPGEIVSLGFLQKNIDYIENWIPHRDINTYREFEAVFWAAVLAEEKIAVVSNGAVLQNLEYRCKKLIRKWKQFVSPRVTLYNIEEHSLLEVFTKEGYRFLV